MRARLEGAMAQRRLRGWRPPLENVNSLIASGGPRLLARARELVVTNGYAANACEAFGALSPSCPSDSTIMLQMSKEKCCNTLELLRIPPRGDLGQRQLETSDNRGLG